MMAFAKPKAAQHERGQEPHRRAVMAANAALKLTPRLTNATHPGPGPGPFPDPCTLSKIVNSQKMTKAMASLQIVGHVARQ